MTTSLPHFLAAALFSLPVLPALADAPPVLPIPIPIPIPVRIPIPIPISMLQAATTVSDQNLPGLSAVSMPLLLTDDALDAIDAAGPGASSYGLASADRGRAFSFSSAQVVSGRIMTISLSQSVAFASGTHAQATTGATAGTGSR